MAKSMRVIVLLLCYLVAVVLADWSVESASPFQACTTGTGVDCTQTHTYTSIVISSTFGSQPTTTFFLNVTNVTGTSGSTQVRITMQLSMLEWRWALSYSTRTQQVPAQYAYAYSNNDYQCTQYSSFCCQYPNDGGCLNGCSPCCDLTQPCGSSGGHTDYGYLAKDTCEGGYNIFPDIYCTTSLDMCPFYENDVGVVSFGNTEKINPNWAQYTVLNPANPGYALICACSFSGVPNNRLCASYPNNCLTTRFWWLGNIYDTWQTLGSARAFYTLTINVTVGSGTPQVYNLNPSAQSILIANNLIKVTLADIQSASGQAAGPDTSGVMFVTPRDPSGNGSALFDQVRPKAAKWLYTE